MRTLQLPTLWAEAGLTVVTMPGWSSPAREGYLWRTGDPEASMWHHTATTAYTPNRDKANVWAGLERDGRLYQDGGGIPTLVVANAYPAPTSSGYGQIAVLDRAKRDERNDLAASGPDDDWAGNRSYWNTEIICDGVGGRVDPAVWEMVTRAAAVQHNLYHWSVWRALGHGQHTSRKIDYRDGRHPNMVETMKAFRADMESEAGMDLERYATRWRNPQDFDAAAARGLITEAEAEYWKTVPTSSPEWQDLRDAVEVRAPLWPA